MRSRSARTRTSPIPTMMHIMKTRMAVHAEPRILTRIFVDRKAFAS